jgi:Protein of unknown function (DUF3892)
MADVQITCINKIPGDDSHNGITHLGTATRKWTRQQVIIWINAKEHTFYTMKDGKRADIYVYDDKQRPPHLQTYADDKWTNDLLTLPEGSLRPAMSALERSGTGSKRA